MWVHADYLKGRKLWNTSTKQACWIIQKILQAGKWLVDAGLNIEEVMSNDSFSIKSMNIRLRGQFPKVNWRKVHCNNQGHPKWRFIMFVVIHQRLYTKDRLDKWGIHPSRMCALCEEELEDHQHLFFKCSVSWAIWKRMLLAWQGITRRNMGWTDEIQWISTHAKGKHLRAAILRMSFVATVYHIWLERDQRTFQQKKRTIDTLIKRIIQDIHFRATIYPKLTGIMTTFMCTDQSLGLCPNQ
ncbi:uncharacterized protein LOC124893864, partial [Capsicum annuum]|uniref:uncharacterized protein LOC124893864 n=1 Tax=Capsicum annuum TaxID=4072 RepID=UPI001FB0D624